MDKPVESNNGNGEPPATMFDTSTNGPIKKKPKHIKKASIFMALDIVVMALFSYCYFKFFHQKIINVQPRYESIIFTAAMQTVFFTYYYTFDILWDMYLIRTKQIG